MLTPYKTRLRTQSVYFKYFKNTLEYLCTFFLPLMYLNFCSEWFKSNLWIQLYPFNWFPVYFQPCLRSSSNNGPTKASWNSTRTNAMWFSWEEEILATRQSGSSSAQELPGTPVGQARPAVSLGSSRGQQCPGLHWQEHRSRKGILPCTQQLLDHIWSLCPVWGSPVQERHWWTGASPGQGHCGGQGWSTWDRVLFTWRKNIFARTWKSLQLHIYSLCLESHDRLHKNMSQFLLIDFTDPIQCATASKLKTTYCYWLHISIRWISLSWSDTFCALTAEKYCTWRR